MLFFARNGLFRVFIRLTEHNAAAGEIVWGQLYHHRVSWNESDQKLLHLTAHIRTNNHIWKRFWKLNFKNGSRKGFKDYALNFDFIIFRHNFREKTNYKNRAIAVYEKLFKKQIFFRENFIKHIFLCRQVIFYKIFSLFMQIFARK